MTEQHIPAGYACIPIVADTATTDYERGFNSGLRLGATGAVQMARGLREWIETSYLTNPTRTMEREVLRLMAAIEQRIASNNGGAA
jgi:hypothetical protein